MNLKWKPQRQEGQDGTIDRVARTKAQVEVICSFQTESSHRYAASRGTTQTIGLKEEFSEGPFRIVKCAGYSF